jgi:hypothetical protein
MSADGRAAEVLADLPRPLWGALLRAVRRAADGLDRSDLPTVLRPYAGWKAERLADERPRLAVARALADDPRLRESVGATLDDQAAYEEAAELDAARLVDRHGEESAVAALAARGRWEDLAVVAAVAGARHAAQGRTGADATVPPEAGEERRARRRLREDLAGMRVQREAQRRRAEAAEQRLREEAEGRGQLAERVSALERELADLREQLDQERRRSRERVGRLRRRAELAEARARIDDVRALRVADDLESLAGDLRRAVNPAWERAGGPRSGRSVPEGPGGPEAGEVNGGAVLAGAARPLAPRPEATIVPRETPAARPGRPCRLPPGLGEDDPAAVEALLKVDGLGVIIDGYNVIKDQLGMSAGSLDEQRRWLLRLAAGIVARYRQRLTVVFDGTDPCPGPVPAVRGVAVVFTSGGESADDRILGIVEGLPAQAPVLVVSSDREVRDDSRALGANTTASAAFLRLAG